MTSVQIPLLPIGNSIEIIKQKANISIHSIETILSAHQVLVDHSTCPYWFHLLILGLWLWQFKCMTTCVLILMVTIKHPDYYTKPCYTLEEREPAILTWSELHTKCTAVWLTLSHPLLWWNKSIPGTIRKDIKCHWHPPSLTKWKGQRWWHIW